MARYIEKKDIDDPELTLLPIRRGCGGVCACLGTCKLIVGYVSRDEYERFMAGYKSVSDFLESFVKKD